MTPKEVLNRYFEQTGSTIKAKKLFKIEYGYIPPVEWAKERRTEKFIEKRKLNSKKVERDGEIDNYLIEIGNLRRELYNVKEDLELQRENKDIANRGWDKASRGWDAALAELKAALEELKTYKLKYGKLD